jgi:flagellar biosynthetic protein FlhB
VAEERSGYSAGPAVEERTEAPTAKRIAEARRAGDIPRSPLLTWAFVLACVVIAGRIVLPLSLERFEAGFDLSIATIRGTSGLGPTELLSEVLASAAEGAIYLLLVAVVAAFAAAFVQVGPLFTFEPLASPLRLRFGDRWLDGAVSTLAAAVLFVAGGWFAFAHAGDLAALLTLGPRPLARGAGALLESAAWLAVAVLAAVGALDLLWRRARHLQSLKMTRTERRRADREEHGDPIARANRRREHAHIASQDRRE